MTDSPVSGGRLQSLDALRGFDMLFIMGGGALVEALARAADSPALNAVARQMEHAAWHGFAFFDMIFPLFLFIAGISFPFSLAARQTRGLGTAAIHRRIIRRGVLLIALGLVYNGILQEGPVEVRYPSVLGRIGLAWMLGALIYMHTRTWTRSAVIAAILVGYWLLLALCPAPDGGGAGPYTPEGNLAGYIDRTVLPGKLYLGIHDPEGLLGTVPATATALLGMMAGTWVRLQRRGLTPGRKALGLAVGGATLVAAGWLWHLAFPINKNLWSSSFVCLAGGLSALLFALFYYLIDVTHWWRQTLFLRVIGLNSITIYMAQRIVGFGGIAAFLLGGLVGLLPETWQETGMAAAYLMVSWLFLYFLWRHRIFLKT